MNPGCNSIRYTHLAQKSPGKRWFTLTALGLTVTFPGDTGGRCERMSIRQHTLPVSLQYIL